MRLIDNLVYIVLVNAVVFVTVYLVSMSVAVPPLELILNNLENI